MTNAVKDAHVLIATDQPGMLEKLRDGFRLLEEIQKGLNNYLEKKRLFFPRYGSIKSIYIYIFSFFFLQLDSFFYPMKNYLKFYRKQKIHYVFNHI
jgi:hypothetical protein